MMNDIMRTIVQCNALGSDQLDLPLSNFGLEKSEAGGVKDCRYQVAPRTRQKRNVGLRETALIPLRNL